MAVGLALFVTAFSHAAARHGEQNRSLTEAEQRLALLDREAAEAAANVRAARLIEAAGLEGRDLQTVMGDLAWASRARAPGARIESLGWEAGVLEVRTGSLQAPFTGGERPVARAPDDASGLTWRVESQASAVPVDASPPDAPLEAPPGEGAAAYP